MSDHDRIDDYLARTEDPSHVRTLVDGCTGCGRSLVFCHCNEYMDRGRCCAVCNHTAP